MASALNDDATFVREPSTAPTRHCDLKPLKRVRGPCKELRE
jgi:hypothetical protein